jgi:hypothetical protein
MRRTILAALVIATALGGCARLRESRLNPFNWFGRGERTEVVAVEQAAPGDPRQLVADVTALNIEQTPTGAIVRATGLPPTQGFWDAELVEVATDDPSVVLYEFRVFPPEGGAAAGTPRTREIEAGAFLTVGQLETVRTITVQGRGSARSARR